jgi:hypothetical protein
MMQTCARIGYVRQLVTRRSHRETEPRNSSQLPARVEAVANRAYFRSWHYTTLGSEIKQDPVLKLATLDQVP